MTLICWPNRPPSSGSPAPGTFEHCEAFEHFKLRTLEQIKLFIIVLIIVLIVIVLIVIKTFMASPLIKMLPQAAARKENSLESLYFV